MTQTSRTEPGFAGPELILAGLMCSRLCHDLMSPVGALTNGLELLADESDPAMRQRCLDLLEQSARTAGDKLRFFRMAFGAQGHAAADEPVQVAEARVLVEGLARGPQPITLTWMIRDEMLPMVAIKVMLNLAQIGLAALVRGGTLVVGAERADDGACEIVVHAAAPRIVFDPEIGRALDAALPLDEIDSRTAPAAIVRALAVGHGGAVQYVRTQDTLMLGAALKCAPQADLAAGHALA